MSAVVALRGVRLGCVSRAFPRRALLAALRATRRDLDTRTVYAEPVDGWLVGCGGRSPAELAVAARPAPCPRRAHLALEAAEPADSGGGGAVGGGGDSWLRLAVTSPAAPHDELLVWPPPLAIHQLLDADEGCAWLRPAALQLLLESVQPPPPPPTPWGGVLPLPQPTATSDAAALETLAVAWGAAVAGAGVAGVAGHRCPYCGKSYSRRYGLRIHVRTHTGHRPLRCAVCARRFADPSNLNKHVRLHRRRDQHRDASSPDARRRLPSGT